MGFLDQFSDRAGAYATFRPTYPRELFAALATLAPARRVACDVATGNGQAAMGLAGHFDVVVAGDGAPGQVSAAEAHSRVWYLAALAEALPLADASCDLVTVAQALHWLDRPAFEAEVHRVLRPRGVLAVWVYTLAVTSLEIDRMLRRFYNDVVGGYWRPGRELADEGYRSIRLPFAELVMPTFAIERELTLAEYVGYVGTWSAVQHYRRDTGRDPMAVFTDEVRSLWGSPGQVRSVRWPLHVRACVRR